MYLFKKHRVDIDSSNPIQQQIQLRVKSLIILGMFWDFFGLFLYILSIFFPAQSLPDDILMQSVSALAGFHVLTILQLLDALVARATSRNQPSNSNVSKEFPEEISWRETNPNCWPFDMDQSAISFGSCSILTMDQTHIFI